MRKHYFNYLYLFAVSGIIVILDQVTKHLVRTNLDLGSSWAPWPWLFPYARIVHWQNTGAAFGMFQDLNVVFAVLAVIVSIIILYYFPRVAGEEWWLRLALSLQLAGAVGNLIDRIVFGYVTDFISIGRFAVFNIADSSISVGVALLILGMWLSGREDDPSTPPDETPAAPQLKEEWNRE